ncbi:MAG: Rpn family recombination-promoting nuclease/putative transposase [Alphaproteobacteria bacterium]|nr:Rpn family recombination-promoting nuclease/putative transposase [Alphaproteobacteria bacterium]
MRFLNPKTDYAFKKIFGSDASRDILISFLNAILVLTGRDVICDVTIVDPYLAPKIEGMKDTFLDVRVKDHRGRSYIVEMQVLNVEGFEKRVLYNACKTYVNQLGKGEPYHILTEVVAVTITDFEMFPDLSRVVSRFRLRADENAAICHQDLELVFAELPKFQKVEAGLETTLDRWLFFLKTAKDMTAIPRSLSVEPAIVKALELANRAAWTEEELDDLEKREMWIAEQRHILRKAMEAERKLGEAEQKAQDAEERGIEKGKAEMLLRLLRRKHGTLPPGIEERVRAADSDQLDEWSERLLDARELSDVFDAPATY